ncbi:MAG: Cell division protein ZipA, partial [uncultured Lysobacter sp.]
VGHDPAAPRHPRRRHHPAGDDRVLRPAAQAGPGQARRSRVGRRARLPHGADAGRADRTRRRRTRSRWSGHAGRTRTVRSHAGGPRVARRYRSRSPRQRGVRQDRHPVPRRARWPEAARPRHRGGG